MFFHSSLSEKKVRRVLTVFLFEGRLFLKKNARVISTHELWTTEREIERDQTVNFEPSFPFLFKTFKINRLVRSSTLFCAGFCDFFRAIFLYLKRPLWTVNKTSSNQIERSILAVLNYSTTRLGPLFLSLEFFLDSFFMKKKHEMTRQACLLMITLGWGHFRNRLTLNKHCPIV